MSIEKIYAIIKGSFYYIPFVKRILTPETGGTNESRYCYSIWIRHLIHLSEFKDSIPRVVAEIGPGDSLGVGLASLLSGSEKYYALDVIKYWNNEKNIQILDDLIVLFRSKARIPGKEEYPEIKPEIDTDLFPSHIISDEQLKSALSPDRIRKIKEELIDIYNPKNEIIKCQIPWYDPGVIIDNTIDFIFSQAVFEHVEDLDNTYYSMSKWLRPAGYMSHQIDFKSHNITKTWNGQYQFSDWEWNLVKGGRPFLINRQPLSSHYKYNDKYNFTKLKTILLHKENSLSYSQLAKKYKNLSDEDLTTSGAFILSQNK
jgi:hypothetical protein